MFLTYKRHKKQTKPPFRDVISRFQKCIYIYLIVWERGGQEKENNFF